MTLTRDERQLLAAVHRWARTNDWARSTYRQVGGPEWGVSWTAPDDSARVGWELGEVCVEKRRGDRPMTWRQTWIPAESVRQAVEVLVALGVLPTEFNAEVAKLRADPGCLVREALEAATRQREAVPGDPGAGPYPATVDEVAEEVVDWIDGMDRTCARGLWEAVRELLEPGPGDYCGNCGELKRGHEICVRCNGYGLVGSEGDCCPECGGDGVACDVNFTEREASGG